MKTKVEKGSQKRAKHPTATDDPDKYIGKWEKYDTPQGISSKKKANEVFGNVEPMSDSSADSCEFKIGDASWRCAFYGTNFGVTSNATSLGLSKEELQRQVIAGFKQVTSWLLTQMKNDKAPEHFVFVPGSESRRKLFSSMINRLKKYIPDGWEVSTEPALGTTGFVFKKKDATRINEGLEQFRGQGITINPDHDDMERIAKLALKSSTRNQHIKGLYDPRGKFIVWDGVGDTVNHSTILEELVEIYGKPSFKMWYAFVKHDLKREDVPNDIIRDFYYESDGYIPFVIEVDSDGNIGRIWTAFDTSLKANAVRNALSVYESINRILESVYSDKSKFNTVWDPSFMPDPDDAPSVAPYHSPPNGVDGIKFIIDFGVKGTMKNKAHRKDNRKKIKPKKVKKAKTTIKVVGENASDIQGGPGQSNDLVPRDRNVITLADLEDTSPNDTDMENNKAPKKQTKMKTKKLNTNTSGLINEKISRSPAPQLNADYELRNDADTETIGIAKIANGVIETLAIRNDFKEDFNGHILSKLMSVIVNDADMTNANLSIRLQDEQDLQHKRFLERFGFRHTQNGIMKRTAGAIRPPSVPTTKI